MSNGRGRIAAAGLARVIGVAASAGGVEALVDLVRGLPADIPAAVLVVLHLPPDAKSRLSEILSWSGPLRAEVAAHGTRIERGRIYVAAVDRHLIVSGDEMWLVDGPRENRVRPSGDPLLRSVAQVYGERSVGVILSGTLDDGVAGLAAIRVAGGMTIVQDPLDALAPGMPTAAIENGIVDHVMPAKGIGPFLGQVAAMVPGERVTHVSPIGEELDEGPSDLSCPDCGGVLRRKRTSGLPYFRCRTGHGYSPESLLDGQAITLEDALYTALRVLEEQASTAGRLAAQLTERGLDAAAGRFQDRQARAAGGADAVRTAIHSAMRVAGTIDAPDRGAEELTTSLR